MTRRTKVWLAVAAVFAVGNAAGAVMAIMAKEPLHATTHIVLAMLGAYVVRLLAGAPQPAVALPLGAAIGALEGRLAHLELSLAGLATGVERMREGQRAVTRLFAQRSANASSAGGARGDAPVERDRDDVP